MVTTHLCWSKVYYVEFTLLFMISLLHHSNGNTTIVDKSISEFSSPLRPGIMTIIYHTLPPQHTAGRGWKCTSCFIATHHSLQHTSTRVLRSRCIVQQSHVSFRYHLHIWQSHQPHIRGHTELTANRSQFICRLPQPNFFVPTTFTKWHGRENVVSHRIIVRPVFQVTRIYPLVKQWMSPMPSSAVSHAIRGWWPAGWVSWFSLILLPSHQRPSYACDNK